MDAFLLVSNGTNSARSAAQMQSAPAPQTGTAVLRFTTWVPKHTRTYLVAEQVVLGKERTMTPKTRVGDSELQ